MVSNLETTRLTAIVTGLVQGVNFRAFTQRRAAELGVTGYVCNRSDGSVQFVAEGARPDLERLLDATRVGPWMAVVENIDAHWDAPTGEFYHFEIRY
ncbi:MAG: acylphosphatase [Chloroflexi bacterium]|nr:acylphosphatase [Chloroflexota bacterium]